MLLVCGGAVAAGTGGTAGAVSGSGFGGLQAAKKLKRADVDIKMIAKTTHHLFQPLLYQVATGIISEGEIAPLTRVIPAITGSQATEIAVALARNPMLVAVQANDIQAFSGGRFSLGLGAQVKPHVERRFSMDFSSPAARKLTRSSPLADVD